MKITKPAAARLREALHPGDPVSLREAAELLETSAERASAALSYLAGHGDLVKVRKTLWVRRGAPANPYRLGARITSPYSFSYGTALALHGAAPTERSEILVAGPRRFDSFDFEGVRYRHVRPWAAEGREKVSVGPEFVWTTNSEKTLVDCVRVPVNAGGFAELLRAAPALQRLDPRELLRWVDHYGEANLAARLGFLFESVDRGDQSPAIVTELESRRPPTRIYLDRRSKGGHLVTRWNLIVPQHLLGLEKNLNHEIPRRALLRAHRKHDRFPSRTARKSLPQGGASLECEAQLEKPGVEEKLQRVVLRDVE